MYWNAIDNAANTGANTAVTGAANAAGTAAAAVASAGPPGIVNTEDCYLQGKRSGKGFVAYCIFSGDDVSVFYNW